MNNLGGAAARIFYGYLKERPLVFVYFVIGTVILGTLDIFGISALMPVLGNIVGDNSTATIPLPSVLATFLKTYSSNQLLLFFILLVLVQLILSVFFEVLFVRILALWRVDLSVLYIRTILTSKFIDMNRLKPGEVEVMLSRNIGTSMKLRHRSGQLLGDFVLSVLYFGAAVYISIHTVQFFLLIGFLYFALHRLTLKKRIFYVEAANHKFLEVARIVNEFLADIRGLQVFNFRGFFPLIRNELNLAAIYVEKYNLINLTIKHANQPIVIVVMILGLYVSHMVFDLPRTTLLAMMYLFYRAVPRVTNCLNTIGDLVAEAPEDISTQIEKWDKLLKREKGKKATRFDVEINSGVVGYDKALIKDINLKFEEGKTYCILGRSGSGKSTLFDVLCGFRDLSEGSLKVGGILGTELDFESFLVENVGLVRPEGVIVTGTIAENIAFLRIPDEVDQSYLMHVAELAGVKDFLNAEGLNQKIDPRGGNLSAGQRQRILLARALYKKPKLLLLDEPTSNLDQETIKLIVSALGKIRGSTTIIIVTHHDHFFKISDSVLELVDEKISDVTKRYHSQVYDHSDQRLM